MRTRQCLITVYLMGALTLILCAAARSETVQVHGTLHPGQAATVSETQTFNSSWTVAVWDYYGTVSALEWQYLPYTPWDPSRGVLTEIKIDTVISGTRVNATDSVYIRLSFVTGWEPVQYQFFQEFLIPAGTTIFSFNDSHSFSSEADLAHLTNYQYFTGIYDSGPGSGGAWYSFASQTPTAAHSINATTTLTYIYYVPSGKPTTKKDCKNGGWQNYDFKNQGDCIQFVNTGK